MNAGLVCRPQRAWCTACHKVYKGQCIVLTVRCCGKQFSFLVYSGCCLQTAAFLDIAFFDFFSQQEIWTWELSGIAGACTGCALETNAIGADAGCATSTLVLHVENAQQKTGQTRINQAHAPVTIVLEMSGDGGCVEHSFNCLRYIIDNIRTKDVCRGTQWLDGMMSPP